MPNELKQMFESREYHTGIDLYRAAAKAQSVKAKGIHKLAYLIFGEENIAIWAAALDPYSSFRFKPRKVATATRYRRLPTISPSKRYSKRKEVGKVTQTLINPPSTNYTLTQQTILGDVLQEVDPQPPLTGFVRDTSRRTRPVDRPLGEFELFVPKFKGEANDYSYVFNSVKSILAAGSFYSSTEHWTQIDFGLTAPSLYINSGDHNIFEEQLRAYALSRLQDSAPGLVAKTLPHARRLSLLYELFELRELPNLLRQTTRFYHDALKKNVGIKKGSDAYLAYRFGWEATWRSIEKMLRTLPDTIKEVNRLMDANGKSVTFRRKYNAPCDWDGSPAFSTNARLDELFESDLSWSGTHQVYFNVTLNCFVDLPRLSVPKLKTLLLLRKFGLDVPSPAEVLDFIPWTWLVDYFSSAAEYLRILDAMNFDGNTINWGLISIHMDGRSTGTFSGKSTTTRVENVIGGSSTTTTTYNTHSRSAEYSYRYHLRKDVLSLSTVASTGDTRTLSAYQASIIAALTGSKAGKRR